MKTAALVVLGLITVSAPAVAASRTDSHDTKHHVSYRMTRVHHNYQWNYRSEAEERRATAELNRQYRGSSEYH
jgi:hypothetical protein